MEKFITKFNRYFNEYNNVDKQIFLILLSRYSLRNDNEPKDDIIPKDDDIYDFLNDTLYDYTTKKCYCNCKKELKTYLCYTGYAATNYLYMDVHRIAKINTYLKDIIHSKQDIIKYYQTLTKDIINAKYDYFNYVVLPKHIIKMLINKVRDNQNKELNYVYCDYCMNEIDLLLEFNKYSTDKYHSRYFNDNYVILQDLLLNLFDNTYGSKKCKFEDDIDVYDYSFVNILNVENSLEIKNEKYEKKNNKFDVIREQIKTLKCDNGIGYCVINKSFIDENKDKITDLLLNQCKVIEIIQLNSDIFKTWIEKEDKYCIISFVKPSRDNKIEYDKIKTKIIDYSNDGYDYDNNENGEPIKKDEAVINEYVTDDISDINKWFK